MKIKHIIYAFLILGLGTLIFYRISENAEQNKTSEQKKSPTIVYGKVLQPQEFADNLSLSGTLEANEQIEVRSEVSGVVEQINFEEGSLVTKGQALIKVNDIELRAQLKQVQTARGLSSENARRAKLLLEKEAISQEEFDVANAEYQSAIAQVQLIQAQLSKTIVRAPFSGKIGLRSISKGSYISPNTLIAQLVNTSQLKITFSIPEKYAQTMKVNQSLTFTTSGSKETYKATIYAIEPSIEIESRTLRIRAITNNNDGKLIPGTFANVSLPLEKLKNALLVPTEALIPIQNGKKIFVVENGKAKEVIVETGARTDKDILITSGLKAGDTILTSGVMTLRNDSPVKVILQN
ncbi:efflux RND transporter periplasmic adaptor subunit [Flavobacterium sp.]|uniref:efflux RND transporter periplasmic adaptor subunit n=1 Tax=Flavobacterium sp. TaxID=239 RepID=UPI002603ECC5|nr:efflux RND transporter periplasmic adaptor subunit [Flavobacterium sp.]MDD3004127.1 efflux RND transporter periplasmic adaptor subunit [Flavobacterium sp.]